MRSAKSLQLGDLSRSLVVLRKMPPPSVGVACYSRLSAQHHDPHSIDGCRPLSIWALWSSPHSPYVVMRCMHGWLWTALVQLSVQTFSVLTFSGLSGKV